MRAERLIGVDIGTQGTKAALFDADGTAHQSEIWADTNLMAADFARPGYSSVLLRAGDEAAADALIAAGRIMQTKQRPITYGIGKGAS